ncbi:hypothetical protein ABIE26_003161 [Pedobacter africanus]|uniref:Uncharacterized protein n=1 Tax=Pedobacter africanus TaxID=151894 RepID=A0ACC6KWC7_9SPHI|nr:hypothetical protein [Pedobacter africanus]MDR6783521.1 hypothetical protein [Pedobacter africanus]
MKYLLTVILFLLVSSVFAQHTAEKPLIQFTGIINDVDSNTAVSYVTVTNLTNKGQRYAANYKGYFSFIAHPGDTILFTAIGYRDVLMNIPADIRDSKYTAMVKMKAEIVNLPTVRVYPWATVEEFTRDFMSMRIADDDYVIAARNLSPESLSGLIQTLPRDGGEIQSINNRLNHDRALNKNMVQTNPLLNPFAWGKLMQSIFKGDKIRSESN